MIDVGGRSSYRPHSIAFSASPPSRERPRRTTQLVTYPGTADEHRPVPHRLKADLVLGKVLGLWLWLSTTGTTAKTSCRQPKQPALNPEFACS